jgi:flagellar motor switch protein FliM
MAVKIEEEEENVIEVVAEMIVEGVSENVTNVLPKSVIEDAVDKVATAEASTNKHVECEALPLEVPAGNNFINLSFILIVAPYHLYKYSYK